MACQVELNSKKEVINVKDAQGNNSELFASLISNPHINVDEALSLYKNKFTSKFKGEEQTLSYKNTAGEEFKSFGEALKATKSGEIEAFSGTNLMFAVNSSLDPSTYNGFINSLISEELILDTTLFQDGQQIIQTAGKSETMKAVKALLVEDSSFSHIGIKNVTRLSNDNFILTNNKEELKGLDKIFDEVLGNDPMFRTYGSSKVVQDAVELPNEDNLKLQLLKLLNNLGVKTTGIAEYLSKYNTKNGIDPSAQALADIANRVIAFQGGEISTEDLSEETAHFIVEGWDEVQIENLLRNIHKSEEWAESSQKYRETYSKDYKGEELEQVVRKEILGKVLANSLQSNFSVENKSDTQQNFIEKLRELIQGFFNKVQDLFKPQYVNDLQQFNTQVLQLLNNDQLQDHLSNEQISASKLVLYSLPKGSSDPLVLQVAVAKKAIELLEITQAQMSKIKNISSNKEALARVKRTLEDIDENNKIASFAGITASVKTQLKYLNQAFKNNTKMGHPFSTEENVVYMTLVNQMRPVLSEIGALLDLKKTDDRLIKTEINETLIGIEDLWGKVKASNNYEALESIVEDLAIKHNWSDETKSKYLEVLKAAKKDTMWAHAYFGSLNHAQNPMLNLFGENIKKITMQTYRDHGNATTDLIVGLEKEGITQEMLNSLKRGSYLLDETDWSLVDETVNTIELEAYNTFSGEENLTLEDYLRQKREMVLPALQGTAAEGYKIMVKENLSPYLERPFDDAYYAKKEKMYKDHSISLETQKWLSVISGDIASIYQSARDENGIIVMTDALKYDFELISKERAFAKNPFKTDGNYKKGLSAVVDSEGKLQLVLEANPSTEAVRAYELDKLDKVFLQELKDKKEVEEGIPAKFLEEIEKLEAKAEDLERERDDKISQNPADAVKIDKEYAPRVKELKKAAFDYMKLNAYIGFERSFWDSLGANESLTERLDSVEGDNYDRAQELILAIKELQAQRNNILKGNRVLNQPSETDVERMSKSEKEYIKEYTESLQFLYQEASGFFKKESKEEEEEVTTENTPNKAYQDALIDGGISGSYDTLEFIKQHTTTSGKADIDAAITFSKLFAQGKMVNIPKRYARFFNGDYSGSAVEKEIAIGKSLNKYAESKLLPYYTRFAPQGYEELMNSLENGNKKTSELLQEITDKISPITVTPNYSFYEVAQRTDLNKNFNKTFEGGRYQFKSFAKGKSFKSKEFATMFAPVNGQATKNEKLFKARELLLNYHREALAATESIGSHNLYKLPQQSKGNLRKYEAFLKAPSFGKVKEFAKDTFGYREEHIAEGETIEGDKGLGVEDMRIIPKYGMRELANQDDLSDELLTSYSWMHEQSMLHRARKEHIGQALMLQQAVLNDTYGNKGGVATATYKMFKSHMDEAYFGVKEDMDYNINFYRGYHVNLSKLLRIFSTFVRFRNLGFAVISPITSWITAHTQFYLENHVGEHVDKASTKLGNKAFKSLAGAAISETGEINSKARMNILLENFLVYDKAERLKNSSFGKVMRNMVKTPYATHSMGNFPVIPRVALSVMYDYRVVDGSIQNFNEYKKANSTLTALEIKNNWTANEKNAMYNFMDTEDGKFSYKKPELEVLLNKTGEDFEKYLGLKNEAIYQRISYAVQNIDGQMPAEEKSIAQRNMLLQLLTVHRSFIPIATARRFKGRHLNLMSGQEEEGSYITMGRFIKGYIEQFTKDDIKNIGKNSKSYWAEFSDDPVAKMNMQRNVKDFVMLNLIAGLGLLLSKIADDEDNKDVFAIQAANYLMLRLTNETASVGVALPATYYEVVEASFVGLNVIPDVLSFGDIGSSKEINTGKWAGFSKNFRYWGRNTGMVREYANMVNIKRVKDQYLLNSGTFMYFTPAYLLSAEKEEK